METSCGGLHGESAEVVYDPAEISYEQLLAQAKEKKLLGKVIVRSETEKQIALKFLAEEKVVLSDKPYNRGRVGATKHNLIGKWQHLMLPMCEMQVARYNPNPRRKDAPVEGFLSPSQLIFKEKLEAVPLAEARERGWSDANGRAVAHPDRSAAALSETVASMRASLEGAK